MKEVIVRVWNGMVIEVYTDVTDERINVTVIDEDCIPITDKQKEKLGKMKKIYD